MEPNFEFLAQTPNAGPTQTHAGCRWTPFDLLVHVDHVFLEGTFVVLRSILQRCEKRAHQDDSNDTPQYRCQVDFALL